MEVRAGRLKMKKTNRLTNRSYPGDLPVNRFISEINIDNNSISNAGTVNHSEYAINNNPVKTNVIYCNASVML